PATRSSREVLPAPDGPKMAVTRPRISTSTSSVNGVRGREIFFSNRLISTLSPAYHPFAGPDRDKCQHHGNSKQSKGVGIPAELHRLKNGERKCGSPARDVTRDHDGCAEFTQGPRKGQQHSAHDAARRERKSDRAEHAKVPRTESASDLFQARIDFLECHACRTHQQGKRH